jgi:hypothetical protein
MIGTMTRNDSARAEMARETKVPLLCVTLLVANFRSVRAATRRFAVLQPKSEWMPWAS